MSRTVLYDIETTPITIITMAFLLRCLKYEEDKASIACHLLEAELIAQGLYKEAEEVEGCRYEIYDVVASACNFYGNGELDFYAKYSLGVQDYCECGRKVR